MTDHNIGTGKGGLGADFSGSCGQRELTPFATVSSPDRLCIDTVSSSRGFCHLANCGGAGIACWLERRTRDRKVASSNHGRSGEIFFSSSRIRFAC